MSESTDTSTVKQKPKKVGERLKESIERFLLMRGLTSKDIISMIDDVLANKAIKSNEEEDGDLRKIRERVALILEGLDETEIARIRKQVSLIHLPHAERPSGDVFGRRQLENRKSASGDLPPPDGEGRSHFRRRRRTAHLPPAVDEQVGREHGAVHHRNGHADEH